MLRRKKTSSWWVFFFLCSSFQTRKNLALCKSYSATVQCFLKTFRKIALKRLWRRPFFVNFWFFKMDLATSMSVSVFQTPFYGWFQKSLWMITLFNAKTPESSKICQIVVAFFYSVSLNFFLFSLRVNVTYLFKNITYKKNRWNWKGFFVKISPLKISWMLFVT